MKNNIIELPEGYELVKNNDNTYSIKKKEFKLEAGKDYYQKDNNAIVIDRKESEYPNQLGFSLGRFETTLSCRTHKNWREATKEEVVKAFKKELIRRYGGDWENVQLKNNIDPNIVKEFNSKTYTPIIVKNYRRGWDVWNKNGLLYYDGKWAEVIEDDLPTKWEDLEEINGYYVSNFSTILADKSNKPYERNKNLFPSKEEAEAVIALAQLCQLRDRYNDGWKPNWTHNNSKYCISIHDTKIIKLTCWKDQKILAFKEEGLRNKFINNFKSLIFKAKPLL